MSDRQLLIAVVVAFAGFLLWKRHQRTAVQNPASPATGATVGGVAPSATPGTQDAFSRLVDGFASLAKGVQQIATTATRSN